jgi:hypothetical protein
MELSRTFAFEPLPALKDTVHFPDPKIFNPLGPLTSLPGEWNGTGFNTIWRPHQPGQDRFLELNLTEEKITFDAIPGPIPNRGLLQPDMNMFGLTYLQQISDSSNGAGLHVEPGIWAAVPQTTGPGEPPTVVRMASIPHGTTINAQGDFFTVAGGPRIDPVNIIPFPVGGTPPTAADFGSAEGVFTELNLAAHSDFRIPPDAVPDITQDMVINPNKVLVDAIAGQNIVQTTVLRVSTGIDFIKDGGGTANTAFLAAGNANATLMTATFWIETVRTPHHGDVLQLQYTQTVMLDFNNLRWPHVTVGTLSKRHHLRIPPQTIDPHLPKDLLEKAEPAGGPVVPSPGPVEQK